jgi:SAM-dependent methyltransferase
VMKGCGGVKTGFDGLRGATALSHLFLRERVRAGDRVVDATCGNGHDTLFLAELVGSTGMVWGFDIQESAITATAALLESAGCREQVELIHGGHEQLSSFVSGPVDAVVFNLGYLPGGDKGCVTRPWETVAALIQATSLLAPGGRICISLYTGHPGAPEEAEAVEAWAGELLPREFHVWCSRQLNRSPTAPYVILVEKGH